MESVWKQILEKESTILRDRKWCNSPNGIINNEKKWTKAKWSEEKMRIIISGVIILPARQTSEIIIGYPSTPSPRNRKNDPCSLQSTNHFLLATSIILCSLFLSNPHSALFCTLYWFLYPHHRRTCHSWGPTTQPFLWSFPIYPYSNLPIFTHFNPIVFFTIYISIHHPILFIYH